MTFLNDEFKKLNDIDLFDDPALEQDLRDKAEIAKKTLSTRDNTKVFLSAGGKNSSIPFSKDQFEEITESLLKRTGNIMGFVLEDANLGWKDIDKILLVGGSTRMKAVPQLIEKISGMKPSMEVHPDEVVAMGAALQGAVLQAKQGNSDIVEHESLALVEISDVNSHSLGVVALDDYGKDFNAIVLKKDTTIPCKVSDVFRTVVDNQSELHVQVTEGEDADLSYVKIVGEGKMKIPPYPKGSPIEVFFEYDHDGIIHVTVFDLVNENMLGELKIERKSNLSEEAIVEYKKKVSEIQVA
jgi:molecular chaperone DnaK